MEKTITTDFKDFEVTVFYHSEESTTFKIMARSAQDAGEIARLKFSKTFTDKCIFNRAEVRYAKV